MLLLIRRRSFHIIILLLHRFITKAANLHTGKYKDVSQQKQLLSTNWTKSVSKYTGVAFDNYDYYVETLTGKDTLQNTVGIVHQDETECLLQDDNVYVDPSIELQSIQQLQ